MVLRRALITGIAGQADSYLPGLFISEGRKPAETNTFRGNADDLEALSARLVLETV
jgi:GDP-D-mannose dehydratase